MAGRDAGFRINLGRFAALELSIRKNLARAAPGEVCMFKEKVDGKEFLVIIANRKDGATVTLISKEGILQI